MRSVIKKIRFKIINNVKIFLSRFSLILLSKFEYQSILLQRSAAVRELVDHADSRFHDGLTGIIFSKDRAFQLDALLESYFEKVMNPVNLIVLFKATNASHMRAYQEVMECYRNHNPAIQYVEEVDGFRGSLLQVLNNVRTKSIFFLVDDIIFINKVDLSIYSKVNPKTSILSLRLSPNLKRSYTMGRHLSPPNFSISTISAELLEFKWFEQSCEWSYPWSVDGNIYSTAEINVISQISKFYAPNSYEDALKLFKDIAIDRTGYCFKESKILNLAINRVQNEIKNQSGNITPEFLLEQWNKGFRMDRSKFHSYIPSSPHEEHMIKFRRRVGSSQS